MIVSKLENIKSNWTRDNQSLFLCFKNNQTLLEFRLRSNSGLLFRQGRRTQISANYDYVNMCLLTMGAILLWNMGRAV